MRGGIGVVARGHDETDKVAAGRVLSAMAAMAVALPGREEPVYRVLSAMVAIAAIADRIVAGFQPLRVISFGGHP